MDLKPVIWISSLNHLENYKELVESTSFWKGGFIRNTPDDFPRIEKTPLLYFSQGELTVENNTQLDFKAFKIGNRLSGNYHNLKDDLSFTLTHSNIKSIEWYNFKKAYPKHLQNWIRIFCDDNIMDGDFLIRVDGTKNTKNLFEMLHQLKEGQIISTSLTDLSDTKMVSVGYTGAILLLISAVINIVFNLMYGTINGNIGGPISVFLMIFAIMLLIWSITWFINKSKEYSKIKNQFQLIFLIFSITLMFYIVSMHILG